MSVLSAHNNNKKKSILKHLSPGTVIFTRQDAKFPSESWAKYSTVISSTTMAGKVKPRGFTSNLAMYPELSTATGTEKLTGRRPDGVRVTMMGLVGQLMNCGGSLSKEKCIVLVFGK